jgi:predicted alpha/beta superfamily hydrolase
MQMQGTIDTLQWEGRTIHVYTPPSYHKDPEARFPSVIVQDGTYLFADSMAELEADFASGATQEVIFIGIEPIERNHEYTPWAAAPLLNHGSFNGEGDAYLKWVTENAIPFVRSRYRIVEEAAQTGITGGSLGALISLYAAFQKPEVFGRFALMSASLWYEKFVEFVESRSFAQPEIRIYMYVGEQEGVGRATLQQYMVPNTKKTYEILKDKVPGGSGRIKLETDPAGVHDHSYFNRYFPNALRFVYPGPNA